MSTPTTLEITFCLNPQKASSLTYSTWVTVRWNGSVLERKSNAKGNGQTWEAFGYGYENEVKLFGSCNASESQAARIFGHVAKGIGLRCNVLGFGAAWNKATVIESTVNTQTGRKLTAAPSIRLGHPDRDKNVNRMRLKIDAIDMVSSMKARKRTAIVTRKRMVINPSTLRVTE